MADALAYECAQGRAQRVRRGVYEAVGDGRLPFPAPLPPEPTDLLPWRQPETDPGPPLIDQDVALDPERWSADAWSDPDDPDVPGSAAPDRADAGPDSCAPEPLAGTPDVDQPDPDPDPDSPIAERMRGDSSTNRRSGPSGDGGDAWIGDERVEDGWSGHDWYGPSEPPPA